MVDPEVTKPINQRVCLVLEGELPWYYDAYVAHGIFTTRKMAELYCSAQIAKSKPARWMNYAILEFELDQPGQIAQYEP